jgi:hypothetical protein
MKMSPAHRCGETAREYSNIHASVVAAPAVRPAWGGAAGAAIFTVALTLALPKRIIFARHPKSPLRARRGRSSPLKSPIASTAIVYVPANGAEVVTAIEVGAPREEGEGTWACDVEMPGVERLRTIHGADSLQALLLALGFLSDRLEYLADHGARFLWPESREPSLIGDILPRLDTLVGRTARPVAGGAAILEQP